MTTSISSLSPTQTTSASSPTVAGQQGGGSDFKAMLTQQQSGSRSDAKTAETPRASDRHASRSASEHTASHDRQTTGKNESGGEPAQPSAPDLTAKRHGSPGKEASSHAHDPAGTLQQLAARHEGKGPARNEAAADTEAQSRDHSRPDASDKAALVEHIKSVPDDARAAADMPGKPENRLQHAGRVMNDKGEDRRTHDDEPSIDGSAALASLLGAQQQPAARHSTGVTHDSSGGARRNDALSRQAVTASLQGADDQGKGAQSELKADGRLLNAIDTSSSNASDQRTAWLSALEGSESSASGRLTLHATGLQAADGSNAAFMPQGTSPVMPSAGATPQPMMTATLTPQLQAEGWDQAFNQQVMRLSHQGGGSAELHLNPPDLGQLQLSLKLGDQQAQLHVMSPHAHVRAAVEAAMPQLRDAFSASGIELGQTSVSDQGAQQQQQSTPGSGQFSRAGMTGSDGLFPDSDDAIVIDSSGPRPLSGIDLFA
ncbi:flagellar hook-length control protein FliK [Kushneria sinocarnis]|uniref:Flagellar hook-length control protein FliK n=1 Tax=Kushneria sinocarnis TaxID=595502 RepID=A0A420WY35_9GAMM|nr:flagellar hook-length control protein FliK [Kushneria sinocarnis]RKR06098.1 flagellar hook-length control protein FliK [Kushneria sinocarnis]